MKTRIDLSNYYQNDLIAKLFTFCRNNRDFMQKSDKECMDICKKFAVENFVINKNFTVEKIAQHLLLYIYGSEKSAFKALTKTIN